MPKTFQYRWEWNIKSKPEEIWPLIADTNKFDKDSFLPVVTNNKDEEKNLRNGRKIVSFKKFGIKVKWEEEPFDWITPFKFGVLRKYFKGPIAELKVNVELVPQNIGTKIFYSVNAVPRNLLGNFAIPIQVGILASKNFGRLINQYDKLALSSPHKVIYNSKNNLSLIETRRLNEIKKSLIAKIGKKEIIEKLCELIVFGDELSLKKIRAYNFAKIWNFNKRDTLEVFLYSTREGLLDLKWDILCPHCRGSSQSASELKEISSKVHCDTCKIDYTINFHQLVEITFSPNKSIRKIDTHLYCIGGPQVTPHIIIQNLLKSGVEKIIQPNLQEGKYRFRTLHQLNGILININENGESEKILSPQMFSKNHLEINLNFNPKIILKNNTESEQLLIIERMNWADNSTSGSEVIALQTFRDLFANEAIRPNEQISVGSLTILFTDLKNSTQLYREIGDATAFGLVMNHFDILRESIYQENGALVKTIGDSVMAVFSTPYLAIKSIITAQKKLIEEKKDVRLFVLKSGIHFGPCILVNLNNSLDYFGSSVNIAARLEGLSTGRDIIISQTVYNDPEVQDLFKMESGLIKVFPFESKLKGFEEERFDLWRIMFEV